MKTINFHVLILIILISFSCKKDNEIQQVIPIPNGDFELWDNTPSLISWLTNSCPLCDPPYETYIVQKVTDASNGQFAAKFIYNNVYSSFANNRFPISEHPTLLIAYLKSSIADGDTAVIQIDIFSGNNIVDNASYYETYSNLSFRKVEIPISQNAVFVDSALIKIVGGKKQSTELFVDNLILLKID